MNVIQIGSREQYSAALAINQLKALSGLYTDFWCGSYIGNMLNKIPASRLKRVSGRYNSGIPDSKVNSLNFQSFLHFRKLHQVGSNEYDSYRKQGEYFTNIVADKIDYSVCSDAYAYTNNAKEIFERVGCNGVKILNQIEPGPVEWDLVNAERELWKNWENCEEVDYSSYSDRILNEWELSDTIVVNSDWSKVCVSKYFPEKKIVKIPLTVSGSVAYPRMYELMSSKSKKMKLGSEIRVLFLGQVCLRKGFQYLVEAASLLANFNVKFDIVGPWCLTPRILRSLPSNMQYHGSVPYSQVDRFYLNSDIFIFPTLSDGFGLTQVEAIKCGLPVIATDRCGEVVVDGVNGFLIKPASVQDLVEKLLNYINNRDLLFDHSLASLKRCHDFNFSNYVSNMSMLIGARCEQ
ncbi:glycosyltransferase [Limnobacter sp.]|uniref:glycosyltransferase n=1 Tax=Limnobacter sp. TaxID=2003368 RepID=UPI0027B9AEC0|nr:glycosyltransferase [Limnobacter sp.]